MWWDIQPTRDTILINIERTFTLIVSSMSNTKFPLPGVTTEAPSATILRSARQMYVSFCLRIC